MATQEMERTIPLVMALDDAFTIGEAAGPPLVDNEYQAPFPFTGKLYGRAQIPGYLCSREFLSRGRDAV